MDHKTQETTDTNSSQLIYRLTIKFPESVFI